MLSCILSSMALPLKLQTLRKAQLSGAMLCRRERDGFSLSAPFRTDRPIRLPALFCLSRVERREGGTHLVWSFDRNGTPKISHNGEDGGTD